MEIAVSSKLKHDLKSKLLDTYCGSMTLRLLYQIFCKKKSVFEPCSGKRRVTSLPNDKISDRSKLKAFADDKINVIEKMKFVFGRVENIVGKGENAGYKHFLLFQ